MKYTSGSKRFVAYLIDCLAIMGIYLLLGLILGLSMIAEPIRMLPLLGIWFYCSLWLVTWLYFALAESSSAQASLGKRVFGLRVVDLNGQRIGFWRATGRFYARILSYVIFLIGFLMVLFTKKRQMLHDKLSKCVVIER